jgi:tRNA-specific 2-thiouridylase
MAGADSLVIVGLSGGVDSAVAALLLRDAGRNVQAIYMDNWDADDEYCTAAQDFQDARAVAGELGIVLHRVSFAADYRRFSRRISCRSHAESRRIVQP